MTWPESSGPRAAVMRYPLLTAFGVSLVFHAVFMGFLILGIQLHWFEHQATWLLNKKKKRPSARVAARLQPAAQPAPREIPLTFVEVDPAVARKEAPKEAKYYGAQNSKAANAEAVVDFTNPKVDGQQEKLVRLENVPKPGPQPLQPAIAPEIPATGETPAEQAV